MKILVIPERYVVASVATRDLTSCIEADGLRMFPTFAVGLASAAFLDALA